MSFSSLSTDQYVSTGQVYLPAYEVIVLGMKAFVTKVRIISSYSDRQTSLVDLPAVVEPVRYDEVA